MNKKIVKKIASIFMLLAIMSATLSSPIMNIGRVVATTMNESAEPAAEIATANDTVSDEIIVSNSSSDEIASDASSDAISEVSVADNSSIAAEQPVADVVADSSQDIAVADVVEVAKASVTKSVASTSSESSSSNVITPLAQPEEGICNDSNSNPPKFTLFEQQEGTNNFVVGYSGGTPVGYSATSITFNLNFGDKEFIATNAVEGGNFIFDDTDREGILVLTPDEAINLLNNMKEGNGNNPTKYTVTFTFIDDAGISCTRTVDAEGFKDYAPVFPTPTLLAARTCFPDEIDLSFNYDGTKYPTDAEFKIFEDVAGPDVVVTDAIPIDNTSSNVSYFNTLNVLDALSHSYYVVVDIDGFANPALDAFKLTSAMDDSGIFVTPPTAGLFDISVVNNTIVPDFTGVNFNGYPEATAKIIVEGPGEGDIQSFDVNINNPAPIQLSPGTYTVRLQIEYGQCAPVNSRERTIVIPQDEPEPEYPNPTFDVTLICDDDGESALVEFTFGDIEDPSGPYPSYAQIILLNDEGVVGEPYAIDTESIILTDPGNYSIGIDTDGDDALEEGDPVVEVISFDAEIIPMIDLFKLSVVNNTIVPEYSVSYDGENELTGIITIDSPVLDEPIIIDISGDTFGDNIAAIENLEPGVYSAMLSVDYGGCSSVEAMSADVTIPTETPPVDEPPVNEPPTNEPPANEPPKLVYTGLENNLFESFVINVKEFILNIF